MAQAAEEFPPVEEVTLPPTPQRTSPSAAEDMTISDLQALRYDTQSKQQSIEAQRLQDQATREQMQKAATPKIAEAQDALKGVEGAAQTIAQQQTPPLPQPPKLQNFLNKDAANMMMAIASVVAGLNSNGRVRGIRANRALAAGINGYVSGNLEVAKLGLEDWKNQMTLQLHENEQIRQKNLDILSSNKMTLEAKKQAFDLEMAPYGMKLEGYNANLGYLEKSVQLDKEMAQIDSSILTAIKKADPTLENLKLQMEQTRLAIAQTQLQKAQSTKAGDDKPGPAGFYFDKDQQQFISIVPTRGELREEPNRYVRVSTADKQAIEFLQNAREQIPQLESLAEKILPTTRLGSAEASMSGPFSKYIPSEHAALVQEFKQRSGALKVEATRLESGSSRPLQGILSQIEQQIPDYATNRETGKTQLKTLRGLIDTRLKSFLGGQVAMPGGGGGQVVPGKIAVIRKSDGQPGIISEQFFDPSKYTKVPEGQPIQAR